jgi:hypothetical protein
VNTSQFFNNINNVILAVDILDLSMKKLADPKS